MLNKSYVTFSLSAQNSSSLLRQATPLPRVTRRPVNFLVSPLRHLPSRSANTDTWLPRCMPNQQLINAKPDQIATTSLFILKKFEK